MSTEGYYFLNCHHILLIIHDLFLYRMSYDTHISVAINFTSNVLHLDILCFFYEFVIFFNLSLTEETNFTLILEL